MTKNIYFRLILYLIIWQIYLTFMSINSPLGSDWLDWHSQRIYNFSEYLKINGFFSIFGFSIWTSCTDCSLSSENWTENIYLSLNIFSNLPYVIFNYFFGETSLKLYGHYIDKLVLFFTGILISELFINFSIKKNFYYEKIIKSQLIFVLFIVNPWTYKMLIAHWIHIYFVIFFLLGILMFMNEKTNLGLLFFFISGCFDYQSSAGLFSFYFLILILSKIKKDKINLNNYFPLNNKNDNLKSKILISLFLPILIYFFLKIAALQELNFVSSGSSILERIGISGNDIHNGGIIGALQFLGGNRISLCLTEFNGNLNSIDLNNKIEIFNCSLSILSMFILSVFSILGLFILYSNEKKFFNLTIFPLLFLLLSYILILQQSSSVHLMGYSYFFSIIFSVGLATIFFKILKKYNYSTISTLISLPVLIGILILCIRVNMLTGVNG